MVETRALGSCEVSRAVWEGFRDGMMEGSTAASQFFHSLLLAVGPGPKPLVQVPGLSAGPFEGSHPQRN